MKTAVSIPDPVFDAAETVARRLGMSRSELYAKALAEFMRRHRDDEVTQALNRVYGAQPSRLDAVLERLQYASLPEEEW
jgi:metal-responsive CopG/Arc/MetJ family transcriptional regulator